MSVRQVRIVKNILAGNEEIAQRNQERLRKAGVLAVNIMASPGAGKTSLVVKTIEELQGQMRIGVIEGDIAGSLDTEKVLAAGAVDAIQINTGGSCHLEANMIQKALDDFDLDGIDILFVENVGNLVCPTHWSLGEDVKLCLLSIPEGHDKPVKYPELFAASDIIVLNKVDLIEYVDFDRDFFHDALRPLNSHAPIIELSCRTGRGMSTWTNWLLGRCAQRAETQTSPSAAASEIR